MSAVVALRERAHPRDHARPAQPPSKERLLPLVDLDRITITRDPHERREDRMTAIEVVAYLSGEPHSDHPTSTCRVLAAFVRRLADDLDDASRAALKPYLPSLVRTAGDGRATRRGWMSLDWLIRTHCAAWLEQAGDRHSGEALRALPAIRDAKTLARAETTLATLTNDSDATWDGACAAAGDPGWDAAWPLAWNVARAMAWDAGFGAAWDAARADGIPAGWLTPRSVFDAVRAAVRDAAFAVVSPAAFAAAAHAASTTNGDYAAKRQAAASAAELALATAAQEVRRRLTQGLEAAALELLGRMTALDAVAR